MNPLLPIFPLHLLIAPLLAVLISYLAYRLRALSRGGAVAAALVGLLVFGFGGLPAAVLLMVFFISSSGLSRLFKGRKARFDEKFSKGSRRDAGQVLANGGAAAGFMLLHGLLPGQIWPWIGFSASLAAVNADTWATELGVLAHGQPRLLTTGRRVTPGTSGAVSLVGTLAALGGSALVIGFTLLLWPAAVHTTVQPLAFFSILTLSGLAGALFDSFLGATVQAIYHCPVCDRETERHPTHTCGSPTRQVRGWRWLNNDWVNTGCSLAAPLIALLIWAFIPAWSGNAPVDQWPASPGEVAMSFPVSSSAFSDGGSIPVRYTCDGENLSPALAWQGLPAGVKSLALITDDPDAPIGTFTHWVVYNLPPNLTGLQEGIPSGQTIANQGIQGQNDYRHRGYDGPCPPAGSPHHYHFTVYALDLEPTLPAGLSASKLRSAMQGHILGQGTWTGLYGR